MADAVKKGVDAAKDKVSGIGSRLLFFFVKGNRRRVVFSRGYIRN